MKLYCYLLAGVMFLCPFRSHSSETANATAFCYSLRFQRGIDPDGNYYLDLSSLNGSLNGELALDFLNSGYSHSAYLSLVDELLGETLSGAMALDVPTGGDANGDGFPDFFEVSQGVTNLPSSGSYDLTLYGSGSVTASWNRPAGSKDGICVLSMKLMPFQPVAFTFGFEVLEYKGPLTYSPSNTSVSGSARLIQTGNPTSTFGGPVEFLKSTTDRFNELTLQPGTWTNELPMPVNFATHLFSRDPRWPTNYYGYLEFTDTNYPSSFYPYGSWMLSIDDLNDANHNGIPDFSDDPAAGGLPRPPRIELVASATNLVLTLHGDVGHVHEIQTRSALTSTNWQPAATLTLTNDPQVVPLPLPAGGVAYWRIKAR